MKRPWLSIGLPLAIAVAGLVLVLAGVPVLGTVLLGIGLAALLAVFYVGLTMSSERDREKEERARKTFERTGRWPE